jgi:flagellar L-ring protein precursor FlgH
MPTLNGKMPVKKISSFLTSLVICSALAGCAVTDTGRRETTPERFSLPPAAETQAEPQEGTIYSSSTAFDLYQDSRARNVGDLVLVRIVETSSGKKEATTKTERQSTVEGGVNTLFGFETWLADRNRNYTPSLTSINATLTNDFDSTGETERKSNVTATLSARIVDVTMQGNLEIRGYQEVRVNNETQHIILTGIIRPEDIAADNSILSSHIADARIEYSGRGVISDKQQPGWLARIIDSVWPF